MLFEEDDLFEVQTAKAWHHKQHFDSLKTYTEKLQYWITIFGSPPSHVKHKRIHSDADGNELFSFELLCPTDNELREFRRAQLNWERHIFFQQQKKVRTFAWEPHETDLSKDAFTIVPYSYLVDSVIPKHESKVYVNLEKEYLSTVLSKTTHAINAASRSKRGVSPSIGEIVEDLRFSLMSSRRVVDPEEVIEFEENGSFFNLRNKEPYDLISSSRDVHLSYMPELKMYVLAEVWDIVHFENYLRIRLAELSSEQYVYPTIEQNKPINDTVFLETKVTLIPAENLIDGFESYILEKYRLTMMPKLIESYSKRKPKQFAYMLYALADLGLISKSTLTGNKTQLHKDLTLTFGHVGSRQSMDANITKLSEADQTEENQILKHKKLIKSILV